MLQIYGNWVVDREAASSRPIMEKAVIFQLHDVASNALNVELLRSIKDFLIDPMYSKIFHNYSVDAHSINNALRTLSQLDGLPPAATLKLDGFAADTMHLARLHDAGCFAVSFSFTLTHSLSLCHSFTLSLLSLHRHSAAKGLGTTV